MTVLETGERKWLAVGVVNEGYDNSQMPGWENESVGYHTDDGKIFQSVKTGDEDAYVTTGRETKGIRNS